jgi:hypothetical protein
MDISTFYSTETYLVGGCSGDKLMRELGLVRSVDDLWSHQALGTMALRKFILGRMPEPGHCHWRTNPWYVISGVKLIRRKT